MNSDLQDSPDWWSAAACAGDLTTFFASNPAAAAAICRPCPVRAECLHDALMADAPNGVWGGLIRKERRKITNLPAERPAALLILRDHLAALDLLKATPETPEGTTSMDTAPAAQPPAAPAEPTMTVGQLLAWADAHPDTKIRKTAGQAKDALSVLRARHHADEQLKSIDEETALLQERLALLQERKAALAPRTKTAATARRGYDTAKVRAWAATQGIPLPARGRIPGHVIDSWRTATAAAPALEQ